LVWIRPKHVFQIHGVDENDAAAICEAMSRATVQARFVPIKTAEQQAALTMLGVC
jgi:transposase